MRSMLLMLIALIFAAPAWAEDDVRAKEGIEAKERVEAAKPVEAIKPAAEQPAAPASRFGVVIELRGPAKEIAALTAALEKDAAYKDAACSGKPARKSAKITCAKADGALMVFLEKNAQLTVRWSMSSVLAPKLPAMQVRSLTTNCNAPCRVMACPPPTGALMCCTTTAPYKAC